MPIVERELALLGHPRLAALATSGWPAWLWSVDGSQILWANAVGAAIFGATNSVACTERRFDGRDISAAQIIRLAASLPAAAQERLERLRGFGAVFGRALTCACSRIVLGDGKVAVLVAAIEPAGPQLTLGDRVRRLIGDYGEPFAAFAPDGTLVYANPAAQARLAGATMLSALGIEALAATVLETGSAGGTAHLGNASFDVAATRLGKDASLVVVLTMRQRPDEAPREQIAPQEPQHTTPAPPAAALPESAGMEAPAAPPAPSAEPNSCRRARDRSRAAVPFAFRLAHGCGRPLRRRIGRIHRTRRPAHDRGIRPAMERDRRRVGARSRTIRWHARWRAAKPGAASS